METAVTTPDTLGYFILGIGVSFGVLVAVVARWYAAYRSLQKDEHTLQRLNDE
jgi:hypothetical protein